MHHVSASCRGETCNMRVEGRICGYPATHKVGEELFSDLVTDDELVNATCSTACVPQHNLTAYLCCECFTNLMGPATSCDVTKPKF